MSFTLSTGNKAEPSVSAKISSNGNENAFITVTASCYLTNGYVQSTGVVAKIYINGVHIATKTVLGNGTRYDAPAVKSVTATDSVEKGKAEKSVPIKVEFWQYVDGKQSGTTAKEVFSGSINISAKTSYTVSYNANGGNGAPGNQTKWFNEDLTISNTKPTRTGYTFKGWALSKTDADNGTWYYQPGSTCGANKVLTLYAVWEAVKYTVSFDANGGSGAPGDQQKTHGATLNLSSTVPTRDDYTFKGWATSATATVALYSAGSSFDINANTTLYAVWELAYTKPRITNLTVERCSFSFESYQYEADEEGDCIRVEFDWVCDKKAVSAGIAWKDFFDDEWHSAKYMYSGQNIKSGKFSEILTEYATIKSEEGNDTVPFYADSSYIFNVAVIDEGNSTGTTASITLGESADPLEFIADNKGIHFGKAVQGNAVGLSDLIVIPESSNFNDLTKTGGFSVPSNAAAKTMTNIPIQQAGRLFVADSVGYNDPDSLYEYKIQTYIPYVVAYPIYERHIRKTDSSTWIYSPWTVRLRNRHSMITAWTGSNITKDATGQTQIPLTGYTVVGDGLTIADNAIVIGQYITAVEISAQGMINCVSAVNSAAKNLIIKKNGTEVAVSMNSSWSTTKANLQLNITPKLITVAEGDEITFHWHAAASDLLSAANARTYITVKEF